MENRSNEQRPLPQKTDKSIPISIVDKPDKDNTERERNKNEENKRTKDESNENHTNKKSFSSSHKYAKNKPNISEKNCNEIATAPKIRDNKDSSDNRAKESFKNEYKNKHESKQVRGKTYSSSTNGSIETKEKQRVSLGNRKTRNPFSQKVENLKESSKNQSKDILENINKQNQSIKLMATNHDTTNNNNKKEVSCNKSNGKYNNNGNPSDYKIYERSHNKGDRSLSKNKEKPLEFKESRECSENKSKELDRSTKEETRNKWNPFSQHPERDRDSSEKRSNEKQTPPQIVEYNLFLGNKNNKKNHNESSENEGKRTNIIERADASGNIRKEQNKQFDRSLEVNSKEKQGNNTTYALNKIESTSKSDCKTNIPSQQTKANRNPFACKTKLSFGQALEGNRNQNIGETFKKDRTPQEQHSNLVQGINPNKAPVPQQKKESKDLKKNNCVTKPPSRQRSNSRYHKRVEHRNVEKPRSQEITEKKDPKTDKYTNFLSTPKVLEEERMFYKRLSIDDISKLDKPGNLNLPHLAHREKVETIPIGNQQSNAKNTLNNQCDLVKTSKVEEENKFKFVIPKLGRKYQNINASWQRHKSYPKQSQKFDTPLLKLERKMEQSNRELQLQKEQEAKAKRNPLHNTPNPELINKPIESINHELENVKNLKTGPTKPNLFETPKSEGGPTQESISVVDVQKRDIDSKVHVQAPPKNMSNLQNEKMKENIEIAKKYIPKPSKDDLSKTTNVSQINRRVQDMQANEKKISKEAKINVVSKLPGIQSDNEKTQKERNGKKLANNKQQLKSYNLEKTMGNKKFQENRKEVDPKPFKERCEVSKTQICRSVSIINSFLGKKNRIYRKKKWMLRRIKKKYPLNFLTKLQVSINLSKKHQKKMPNRRMGSAMNKNQSKEKTLGSKPRY